MKRPRVRKKKHRRKGWKQRRVKHLQQTSTSAAPNQSPRLRSNVEGREEEENPKGMSPMSTWKFSSPF